MLKKETTFAMLDEFYPRYDAFKERDRNIQAATEKLVELCGGEHADHYWEVSNALLELVTSCGTVGYFIGLSDGARALQALTRDDLAEKLMGMACEL